MGQTQNELPASAISASSEQTPAAESVPTTAVATVVAANKLANPSIAKLPTGGGDDDDDDEDDEEGDDD